MSRESAERARKRRELERDFKRRQREKLRELRGHLKHAKKWRAQRRRKVREACKHARALARAHAQVIKAEHKAAAIRQIEEERRAARASCSAGRSKADTHAAHGVNRAAHNLAEELAYQRSLAAYESKPKRVSRAERRAESDSEVEQNIPHELIPVWRAVKSRMQAGPRRTRTEAFAEWAAEHQAEVRAILDAEIEASIEELVAHEEEQRAALGERVDHWGDDHLVERYAALGAFPDAVPF